MAWFDDNAPANRYSPDAMGTDPPAPPQAMGSDPAGGDPFATQLNALYQQYYQRDATPDELAAHRGNPGGLAAVETLLKQSQSAPAAPAAPTATGSDPAGGGPATTQRGALQAALAQGLSGQAAVDWVQQHYPQFNQYGSGIQYYPGSNQFGGAGWYAAPGGGQYGFDWIDRAGGGGGGGGFGGPGGAGYNAGNFGGPPPLYTPPTFTAPSPYAPPTFTAPTGLDYQNDPGYKERLKMGTDAIQASAAAKGSLLSGGTLKALDRYAQDYASNEFGNVYNRALGTFQTNAGLGLQGYQINAANYWKPQELGAQYGLAGYQTNVDTQRNAQQDYWSRLRDLYSGGLNATSQTYQRPPGG